MGRVEFVAGKALTLADLITPADGFILRSNYSKIIQAGGVVSLYLTFISENALTANSDYSLFSVDDSIKPQHNSMGWLGVTNNLSGSMWGAKSWTMKPLANLAANQSFYCYATYIR